MSRLPLDCYIMYFDIGSNIGKWALANINQCDKIIAIEASPITFNNLVSNKAAMEKEWLQPIAHSWLAKKYAL